MKLSVLIPMYNESSIVLETARTLHGAMSAWAEQSGHSFEILFSDDGSTDGCGALLREAVESEGLSGIRVIGYPDNRGKGSAVREAVLASEGDIVLYTDCDLAYGTDVIGEMTAFFKPETDVVIGSRRLGKDGYADYTFLRKVASQCYVLLLKILTGFRLSDSQCGCKAFRGDKARKIFALCETNGWAFDQEVLMLANKMGLTIHEMPVRIINHRESKIRLFRDTFRMIRDILKIRRRVSRLTIPE